ncbi:MAG: hypothetical protein E3J56_12690 [Candidatus Aminicenantes bacterium]|nr:MAG: hypothetical protein E3J56_12690 [Candidatus Aminicenantes bacterium]
MSKIEYINKRFNKTSLYIIETTNEIIEGFLQQGFDLTLRQLYYQFIAQDLFPESWRDLQLQSKNIEKNYNKLGSIINDARLTGLVDWNAIADRTRETKQNSHWEDPKDIIESCIHYFEIDKWEGQPTRPEVWIEKDALIGVISNICRESDVTYFSCRGYNSQSNMWRAGQRMLSYIDRGQNPIILHLGDHDPSGIDMTRDIRDRLNIFAGNVRVDRLALNMDQVNQYNPPPSPAKITDSRSRDYIQKYGHDSWELDALDPSTISDLINDRVIKLRDEALWQNKIALEEQYKTQLRDMADDLNS